MSATVYSDSDAVAWRLAELGLTPEILETAVAKGQLAFDNCTTNHPRMFPPLAGWAETVRGVREGLIPLGWQISDDRNYALAVHPSGDTAIAVATGNELTGLASGTPATKCCKGTSTLEAVMVNVQQLLLFAELSPRSEAKADAEDKRATWILLIHRTREETRSELSLPVVIGGDGRVTDWRERIILKSIPRDPQPLRIDAPQLPDLDVPVKRRSA